jgi:hypothetical protein
MPRGGVLLKHAIGAVAVLTAPCLCGVVLARGVIAVADDQPRAHASVAGGVSLTPQRVERIARVGATGTATVTNGTGGTVRVRIRVRPWRQARGGVVTPDPRRTLSRQVSVKPSTFRLAAGARRSVAIRLKRHPPGGALFGGIDVLGVPAGAKPLNGIVPRYRLVGSLRMSPVKPVLRVRSGRLKVTGRSGRHALVLPVRNRGNTVEPITGRVTLIGPRGRRPNLLRPIRIVPRRTVNLTLGTYRGLLRGQPRGRYAIAVTLTQRGRTVLRSTRRFTLR